MSGANWLEYEYQVRWSVRDGETVSVPAGDTWAKTRDAAVSLTPPFTRRVVEIDADRQLFAKHGIASAVVEFATMVGGKPRLQRKVILRAADAAPTTKVAVYHDRQTPDRRAGDVAFAGGQDRREARGPRVGLSVSDAACGVVTRRRRGVGDDSCRRRRPVRSVCFDCLRAAGPDRPWGAGRRASGASRWRPSSARSSTCRPKRGSRKTTGDGRSSRSSATSTNDAGAGGTSSITESGGGGVLHFLVLMETPERTVTNAQQELRRIAEGQRGEAARADGVQRRPVCARVLRPESLDVHARAEAARHGPGAGPGRQPDRVLVRSEANRGDAPAAELRDADAGRVDRVRHDVHRSLRSLRRGPDHRLVRSAQAPVVQRRRHRATSSAPMSRPPSTSCAATTRSSSDRAARTRRWRRC